MYMSAPCAVPSVLIKERTCCTHRVCADFVHVACPRRCGIGDGRAGRTAAPAAAARPTACSPSPSVFLRRQRARRRGCSARDRSRAAPSTSGMWQVPSGAMPGPCCGRAFGGSDLSPPPVGGCDRSTLSHRTCRFLAGHAATGAHVLRRPASLYIYKSYAAQVHLHVGAAVECCTSV